ncbi:MAG: GIY-YIG nuclease family protein [Fidelibacterota bacterium]
MFYTYIIRSKFDPIQTYIGYSSNLSQRVQYHNSGKCKHTAKYLPWELIFYAAFNTKKKAMDFEKYLKSHSGKAFASKRLL